MLRRVGILACISFGGISLAVADPPANPTAPATASAPAAPSGTTPAQTPAAPAKDAKPDAVLIQGTPEVDTLEKHFLAEGYKLEMRNGEKYFCRREEQLGSRLGAQKVCGTAQQLAATEREAQAAYQRGKSQQNNPSGK